MGVISTGGQRSPTSPFQSEDELSSSTVLLCECVHSCMHGCLHTCVCVCVCERERDGKWIMLITIFIYPGGLCGLTVWYSGLHGESVY